MLTIQPKVTNFNSLNSTPAFGHRENPRYNDIAEDVDFVEVSGNEPDEDEVEAKSTRAFWEQQKRQFDEAANDIALPQPVRKGAKIFAIVSEAAIDAIAVFCTGKMVIGGAQKALKSPKVQNVLTGGEHVRGAMHTVASGIKFLKPVAEFSKAVAGVVSEKSAALSKTVGSITAKQVNNAVSGTIATGAGVAGAIDETDKYIKSQRQEEIQEAA